MGSMFKKPTPKMPAAAPPPPTVENKDAQLQVRSAQRARSERKGMKSTLLAGQQQSAPAATQAGTSNLLG